MKNVLNLEQKLPKNIGPGDSIYFYEPIKSRGSGKVVGESKIKEIYELDSRISPYPVLFLYWAENIKKGKELVSIIKKINGFELSKYKNGYIYNFMYDKDILDYILEYDELPAYCNRLDWLRKNNKYFKNGEKSRLFIIEHDEWLRMMGFWNEYDESYYKYAILLENTIRYKAKKELREFNGRTGLPITKAPQGYYYIPD